jgi:hypothetical protein
MELFAFLATVNDEAFAISYFMLSNVTASGGKIAALTEWFLQLRQHGVDPDFIFLDKDQSEIAAAKVVWSHAKIQLCCWHMKRALRKRLRCKKNPDFESFNFTAFQFDCAKDGVVSPFFDKPTSMNVSILQSHHAFCGSS